MCASEGTIKRRKQIRMVLWYLLTNSEKEVILESFVLKLSKSSFVSKPYFTRIFLGMKSLSAALFETREENVTISDQIVSRTIWKETKCSHKD